VGSLVKACGTNDAAIMSVAREIATTRARGLGAPDIDAVTSMLRSAGEPHMSPRVLFASGKAPLDDNDLVTKLGALRAAVSSRRGQSTSCGVAFARTPDGGEIFVGIVVDVLADLAPLPVRARTGQWLSFDARAHVPLHGATFIVLGPRGAPRTVPTAVNTQTGAVRARFALDQPGAFTVQLVGDLDDGPRPLLEARVFADVEPPTAPEVGAAPGEEAASGNDAEASLTAMIGALRRADNLPALRRDRRLDAIARAHAARMRDKGIVAHDLGDGDLRARLSANGPLPRVVGENVARANTIVLAHRALYASASHRMNLLHADYTNLGVGVAKANDGSVYVCEVFTTAR